MANKLTEEMVIARTKVSDLSKIKRLNCWGSELIDVSLLRKMPCVEVLSLSINKINNLADFQFCKRLEELYIRQNNILNLNEVVYLQNLPNLKNLWLGENPCANVDGYRLAVIKALPQLQKLDNIQITQEEVRDAQRYGKNLVHPDDIQESEEEEYNCPIRYQQEYSESEYSPVQRSPPRRQEPEYDTKESEDGYPREVSEESRENTPPRQVSPPRRNEPLRRTYLPDQQEYTDKSSYDRESPKQIQYYEQSPTNISFEDTLTSESTQREPKLINSQSSNSVKEYSNGDKYHHSQQHYHTGESGEVSSNHGQEKRERYTCPAATHRPPFNRRPMTRNSNILSAVLCLVKELDYPSLEVVEMAVRCRMDELDE